MKTFYLVLSIIIGVVGYIVGGVIGYYTIHFKDIIPKEDISYLNIWGCILCFLSFALISWHLFERE